jgi:hypothetical protein
MTADRLRHTNPDPILCLIILLVMPLFAIGSVMYSIVRWKTAPLSRPSWNRNPFDWWHDPLQSLFVSRCVCGTDCRVLALSRIHRKSRDWTRLNRDVAICNATCFRQTFYLPRV